MHHGSVATIEQVIDRYDQGGESRRPSLSTEMQPLGLTVTQKADLAAFLRTLTSRDEPVVVPELPR